MCVRGTICAPNENFTAKAKLCSRKGSMKINLLERKQRDLQ